MMGEQIDDRLSVPTGTVMTLLVVVLVAAGMALVAGAAGADDEQTTESIDAQLPAGEQLYSEETSNNETYAFSVSEDGIELNDNTDIDLSVLAAEVDSTNVDARDKLDVALIAEESFSMYADWGTHTPGSGTVEDLVEQDVLDADSVSNVEDRGIGLNTRGVWEYGCDIEERTITSWPPWETEEYPWCGWHGDIGSADGEVGTLVEEGISDGLIFEYNLGQDDYNYEIYSEATGQWVELPRGTNEGIRGYWEYTDNTGEDILNLGSDITDGLYHIDHRLSANDWAFDTDELSDTHVRITWDEPLFGWGALGDEVKDVDPVDIENERYEGLHTALGTLTPEFGDRATFVINGEASTELSGESEDNLDESDDDFEKLSKLSDDLAEIFPEDEVEELDEDEQEEFDEVIQALLDMWWYGPDADDEDAEEFNEFTVWDSLDTAINQLEDVERDSEKTIVLASDAREPVPTSDGFWDNLFGGWAPDWFTDTFGIEEPDDHDKDIAANDNRVQSIADDAADAGITIHTVAIGDNPDTWRLDTLSDTTGGTSVTPDEAHKLEMEMAFDGESEVDLTRELPTLDISAEHSGVSSIEDGALEGPVTQFDEDTLLNDADGTTSFKMDISICDEYEHGGTEDVEIAGLEEVNAQFNNYEGCDGEVSTETVEADSDLIFEDGDSLSDIDEAVDADSLQLHMDDPSEVVPDLYLDDSGEELDLGPGVLVALPVAEAGDAAEHYDGYVLMHADLDVPVVEDTEYEVVIDEENIDAADDDDWYEHDGTEGVVEGETMTVPVEITNYGDDNEVLSELITLHAGEDGEVVDSERVDVDDLDEDGEKEIEMTWETGSDEAGFSDTLEVQSDRDSMATDERYDVVRDDVDLMVESIDTDKDPVNITEYELDETSDPVEFDINMTNVGPTSDDVKVELEVGERMQSLTIDEENFDGVVEGDGGEADISLTAEFNWTPGYGDLLEIEGDPKNESVSGTIPVSVEAYDTDEDDTVAVTYGPDPDGFEDFDDLDEGDLEGVEIEVNEVEIGD